MAGVGRSMARGYARCRVGLSRRGGGATSRVRSRVAQHRRHFSTAAALSGGFRATGSSHVGGAIVYRLRAPPPVARTSKCDSASGDAAGLELRVVVVAAQDLGIVVTDAFAKSARSID